MRVLTKYFLILILFGFAFWGNNCFSQTTVLPKETQQIVNRIENVKYILVDGEPTTKNIKLAKRLLICAKTEDLYSLLESDNQIVICFVCWILAKKGDLIIERKCNELSSVQKNDGLYNIIKIKRKSCFLQFETAQSFVCNYLKNEKYLSLLD